MNDSNTSSTQSKKLYRSRTDRKIAGVCGGISKYFGVDVTIVRVLFLLLLLPGGLPGFVPYLILWLITPIEPAIEDDPVRKY